MARASKLIINTEDAERKIKQVHESALLAVNAIDSLISAVIEATKAIKEYQNIADDFVLERKQDVCECPHHEISFKGGSKFCQSCGKLLRAASLNQ